jgi:DNA gyrase subunit A
VIKRFASDDYENSKLSGRTVGSRDFTFFSLLSSNSQFLLFFTNKGKCYPLRTSFVPAANGDTAGVPLARLIDLKNDEAIINMIAVQRFDESQYIMFCTREGQVKRILLSTLSRQKEGGIEVISLKGADEVVSAFLTDGNRQVIIGTARGMAIRFVEQDVRDMGLSAGGVRGISLVAGDRVVSMVPLMKKKSTIFTVTSLGFGKRSDLSEYGTIKRGGKGIITYRLSDKVGEMVGLLEVVDKDQILFLTKKGKVKRVRAKSIKIAGRATQGMAAVAITQSDQVVSIHFKPEQSFGK